MYQMLRFDKPIPSCGIHELKFVNNSWEFIYALLTPIELTNENDQELLIYEYISDLKLVTSDVVNLKSINLRIKTYDEYLELLKRQAEADIEFREEWKKNNPEAVPNKVTLDNQHYTHGDLLRLNVNFIASIIEQNDTCTVFAAI